jgi:PAS domain S-box-containing protein
VPPTRPAGEPPGGSDDPAEYLRRELYQRVREDTAIFDFLQDGSLDGLWYWDLDNPEHEWLSPRLKEVFGYADEDIPNTSAWWQANIFPDDLETALDNYTQHLSDPHHRYDQIVRYRHRDGSTVWVRCRGIAIRDATGRPIRMLGAHTDITPIKNVEEALADRAAALEAANAELAAGNKVKAELAGVLSHAINQPLCVITNYGDLLIRKWDRMPDERRQAWVHSLDDAARELSRLIADLMLMFRLDVSVVTVSRAAVDVRTALDEALQWLPGDVRVDRYIDDGLAVLCDRGHFRHVLVNLLANAVKYGREPIEVHGRAADGSGRLLVSDHGDGAPAEFVPQLFERFSRADGAAGLGAGLGLFIVDELLRANGGAVAYQPTPSGGAGIGFELELAGSAAGSRPDAAALVTARGAASDR